LRHLLREAIKFDLRVKYLNFKNLEEDGKEFVNKI